MVEPKSNLALGAARVGAVLLALGALGYFVVTAQQNAQSSQPETPNASPAEPSGDFFPSSKSVVIDSPPEDLKDFYLPSSKSGIVPVAPPKPFGERKPAEADEKKPEVKDPYFPSSKSLRLPPEAIKSKKAKPKSKSQQGAK